MASYKKILSVIITISVIVTSIPVHAHRSFLGSPGYNELGQIPFGNEEDHISVEEILRILDTGNQEQLKAISEEMNRAFRKRITWMETALFDKYIMLITKRKINLKHLAKLAQYGLQVFCESFLFCEFCVLSLEDIFNLNEPKSEIEKFFSEIPSTYISEFSWLLHHYLFIRYVRPEEMSDNHPEKVWPEDRPSQELIAKFYIQFVKDKYPNQIESCKELISGINFDSVAFREKFPESAEHKKITKELALQKKVLPTYERLESKTYLVDFIQAIEEGDYIRAIEIYRNYPDIIHDYSRLRYKFNHDNEFSIPDYGYEREWFIMRQLHNHGLDDKDYASSLYTLIEYGVNFSFIPETDLIDWAKRGIFERITLIKYFVFSARNIKDEDGSGKTDIQNILAADEQLKNKTIRINTLEGLQRTGCPWAENFPSLINALLEIERNVLQTGWRKLTYKNSFIKILLYLGWKKGDIDMFIDRLYDDDIKENIHGFNVPVIKVLRAYQIVKHLIGEEKAQEIFEKIYITIKKIDGIIICDIVTQNVSAKANNGIPILLWDIHNDKNAYIGSENNKEGLIAIDIDKTEPKNIQTSE